MKTGMLALCLMMTSGAFAQDLNCEVKMNTVKIWRAQVSVSENESLRLGDFEGFRIYLHNRGAKQSELEVYDGELTQRIYAKGSLQSDEDLLSLSLWKREALLDVQCHKEKR